MRQIRLTRSECLAWGKAQQPIPPTSDFRSLDHHYTRALSATRPPAWERALTAIIAAFDLSMPGASLRRVWLPVAPALPCLSTSSLFHKLGFTAQIDNTLGHCSDDRPSS